MGDNPSRHSPIYVKFNFGNIPANSGTKEKICKKPAWYRANNEDIEFYTETLHNKMKGIFIPDCLYCTDIVCKDKEHSANRDSLMMDILCTLVETSHQTIPLTSGKKRGNNESNCPINTALPG